jgi:hypothetical protein
MVLTSNSFVSGRVVAQQCARESHCVLLPAAKLGDKLHQGRVVAEVLLVPGLSVGLQGQVDKLATFRSTVGGNRAGADPGVMLLVLGRIKNAVFGRGAGSQHAARRQELKVGLAALDDILPGDEARAASSQTLTVIWGETKVWALLHLSCFRRLEPFGGVLWVHLSRPPNTAAAGRNSRSPIIQCAMQRGPSDSSAGLLNPRLAGRPGSSTEASCCTPRVLASLGPSLRNNWRAFPHKAAPRSGENLTSLAKGEGVC